MREDTSSAALGRLLLELETADATEPAGAGLKLLRDLLARPRLMIRLDQYSRAYATRVVPGCPRGRRAPQRSDRPIGLALASMDRDGHVRERAVTAIAAHPHPELAPFLVLRTGDWVAPVRVPARAALVTLLAEAPDRWVPAALPMARHTAGRQRTGFAAIQLVAAVLNAPGKVRRSLTGSRDPAERRLAFTAGLSGDRLSYSDLRALALADRDATIRSTAAERVSREALWRRDAATLRLLAAARSADVRGLGYTGLVRLGLTAEALTGLTDDSVLVRAIARDAARRDGLDATARYRDEIAGDDPAVGAVLGLAESGGEADAPALQTLLSHPSRQIRAAVVQGLSRLSVLPVEAVLPLLHDPAPAVVREAAEALRQLPRRLPPGVRDELRRDPRPEVRRAGYRLTSREPAARFRAAVELAMDPDPALAARGRADAVAMGRWAPWAQHRTAPELATETLPPGVLADLAALVEQARPAFGAATDELLATVGQGDRALPLGPAPGAGQ